MTIKSSPEPRSIKKPVGKNSRQGDSNLKQRGENLQGSSDIYRSLVENLHEVVFSLNLEGTITYINPVIEKLSGYQVDQVIGKTFDFFVYPDDLPGLKSSFIRTLAGGTEPYEFRVLDKNGKVLNVHTSSRVFQENGKAVGLTGVMVEITDLKRTEQAVLDAEAKYHTLIEQIPAAVYTDSVDEQSSTIYISPQITKLSGYTPDEWIADPAVWGNILHPEDRERVLSENDRTNRTGDRFLIEYRLIAKEGGVVWIRDEATILYDSNSNPICWHGVMLDIT